MSSITAAKHGALHDRKSSLSSKEMGFDQSIGMTNKNNLYLDARKWLENYGGTYAEQSPNSLISTLPPGRKHDYYCAYQSDRLSKNAEYASLQVFMLCWRLDVSWLIVNPKHSQQSKCGVCSFFKLQIDQAPRGSDTLVLLKQRLGVHFQFQAAQRLCQDRVEEACAQSGGDMWMMKIDRMDHTKTMLPSIWAMSRTPMMKHGNRLKTSVIGSRFSGTGTDVDHLLTTNFEDFSHGADTQFSVILENLVYVAERAKRLPKEFLISADNTCKETKNSCLIFFAVWLLSLLESTCLWSIVFMSLITGHTHDNLDRFFSLLRQSLMGRDFYTIQDIWKHVRSSLRNSDRIHTKHVCKTWNFTKLGTDRKWPKIHGHDFARIHCLNVFRAEGGIYLKWKQFMTDLEWSRPVFLIHIKKMRRIQYDPNIGGRHMPDPVAAHFKEYNLMWNWCQKWETSHEQQLPENEMKQGIECRPLLL